MRIYFVLYHEATVVNLMEVIFYHKHVCSQCGERFIELVDYCARKLTRLQSGYDFRSRSPQVATSNINEENASERAKQIAKEIENRTPQEDMAEHLTDIEFKVCISSCKCLFLMRDLLDVVAICKFCPAFWKLTLFFLDPLYSAFVLICY